MWCNVIIFGPMVIDNVNIWCIVFFPVLKPLACGIQSRCLGWTYKLPGGQKFSIKLSPLSVRFPQTRPLNVIKKTSVYKLPRGAIYKPPCVQLTNNPFFCNTSSSCTVKLKCWSDAKGWFPKGRFSQMYLYPEKGVKAPPSPQPPFLQHCLFCDTSKATQKWLKRDSGRPTPTWPKLDTEVTTPCRVIFEPLLTQFGSLWVGTLGITFELLLGHSIDFISHFGTARSTSTYQN